jgi:sigma-B regulation protein RsbU (phosphoserine phosphatase)
MAIRSAVAGISPDLQSRIDRSVEIAREVSSQTDPQEMVRRYRDRTGQIYPRDASISLSRRDLVHPSFRVTRDSRWSEDINPWKSVNRLPVHSGGILADLIYGNEVRVIEDVAVDAGDPAASYLEGMRSLIAMPLFDGGESLNMVVVLKREPGGFDLELLPDQIISANLFGRATHNLVLAERLRVAYERLDAEFAAISKIQRSLLPKSPPPTSGLEIASYYATAQRAGGDYYDFFKIDDSRTGILIADVSGHGAAAAVVMARMHAMLHAVDRPLDEPGETLAFANEHLLQYCRDEMSDTTFVTAFYAVYNAADHSLHFATAGHNPPRLRRGDGAIASIAGSTQLPIGIQCGLAYDTTAIRLDPGDDIVLYTDGIVEAANPAGDLFDADRLDGAILLPHVHPTDIVSNIVDAVNAFADGASLMDDRTLVALTAL